MGDRTRAKSVIFVMEKEKLIETSIPVTLDQITQLKIARKRGGICFITSAYAEYLNKSDDCKELMTLRRYRDTYVLNLDNGGNIIKEYYRIAPLILNSLYESTEKDKIFKQVIIPNLEKCLNLIENNDMEKAFNTYSELVLTLKSLTKIN